MKIKTWLLATLLCFVTGLFAQNEATALRTKKVATSDFGAKVYYEKEIYIHRYVLEDKVDVEITSSGRSTFTLLNEERREIRSYELTLPEKSVHSVNLAKLPKGKYYVRVKKGNKSFVRKVYYE